ncbi:MAG: bifunctional (p)ppGpp synthetase/guanosine-3',5'-bis(diphosphate) 3'-pyrophosphohydrolase [Lentimicrobiaceae bacterium]|nr:bifunctional (p)ppGpp synthetase/guanosine-3',5'-bis(diphosphate) 3'-pyrophosphohydrolase [Lentimicrobiaceae bacterium]
MRIKFASPNAENMNYPDTYSKEEQLEMDKQYDVLLKAWNGVKKEADVELVKKAYEFAALAHKDARRKSGEPYIFHPIAVAIIVAQEIGMGATSITSALLHDVVEDTDYTVEYISKEFGPKVARVVKGLTKLSSIDFQNSIESIQAENYRKIVNTMSEDIRVILVKLADRLHNMRTLDSMAHHKQLKIASETVSFYAPLAYRLGLYAIKSELENLCLKYINPQVYNSLSKQLDEIREDKIKELEEFCEPIKKELINIGIKAELKILERSQSSLWERMHKFGLSIDEIYDAFVLRIIIDCPIEEEKIKCWQTFGVLTMFYRPNNSRLRDWLSFPKTNGYESIHAVFMSKQGNWIETQIRTQKMDIVAERGVMAYLKYKNDVNAAENSLKSWLDNVIDLTNSSDSSAIEFINSFKLDLFSDEIFVFTPKGEMKRMPKGATVLDFAYMIHSEIGNHCIGANVNKKLTTIDYVLNMGDQVEVITSQYQHPQEKNFDFLITSLAKSRLKAGIKDYRKSFKENGKDKLREFLDRLNVEFTKPNRNLVVDKLGLAGRIDLYYYVAIGKIGYHDVEPVFKEVQNNSNTLLKILTFGLVGSNNKTEKAKTEKTKVTEGNDLGYTISTCCNPIPGDDVVAITFPNEPVQIHRPDCPKAIQLMSQYGKNIVKAKWQFSEDIAFLATLKISGVNKMGFGSELFSVLSGDFKLDLYSIKMQSEGGMVDVTVSFYVNNLRQLETVIDRLRKMELVKKVMRIDRNIES